MGKRSFRHDTHGVVVGLVIMIVSIFIVAILFVSTMPAVGIVWQAVIPMLPTERLPIMDLMNNVTGWTLLILVLGCLAYGAALSFKRDPVDIPG